MVAHLFDISDDHQFNAAALATFRYQYEHTSVYRQYVTHLGVQPDLYKNPVSADPVFQNAVDYRQRQNS
jgi:hypothetical protein